ncbi:MAG: hypothetical protein GWN01_07640 [Nitrosopumilaceae archaeon]|nr:hypothetical protein [Nitrosopumilaceae archaeon]NIU00793.1 hypothetical protein [Nitrosopumilaceae archaeon]NIU87246.1 hypothetical protein [Nitrosopumilaceae archaeon]NIV65774.1 hypothetical protein [Nitrosopumilaceae archaeon]NIX61395.1 hypothetical protein [Nitrosopumilaceae archaeon]
MVNFSNNKKEITTGTLINTVWVSTFLAMIFAIPPLGIFLGFYYNGNLVLGIVAGFGLHFVTLAFSEKISKILTRIMS